MNNKKQTQNTPELSERFTGWVGSTSSLFFHTCIFIGFFLYGVFANSWDRVLLALTTIVSLEAIYLAIFIQMTVNRNTQSLAEVEEDIDEIQEDIDEIQEDVDEIQEDVGEIQEDVEVIHDEVDDLSEGEGVNDLSQNAVSLEDIKKTLEKLATDIENLKGGNKT